MEIIITISALLSILASSFCVGAFAMLLRELKDYRRLLKEKINEFSEITRQASEANLSHAAKMLSLEDRIAGAEQKVSFFNAQQSTTPLGQQWGSR